MIMLDVVAAQLTPPPGVDPQCWLSVVAAGFSALGALLSWFFHRKK